MILYICIRSSKSITGILSTVTNIIVKIKISLTLNSHEKLLVSEISFLDSTHHMYSLIPVCCWVVTFTFKVFFSLSGLSPTLLNFVVS